MIHSPSCRRPIGIGLIAVAAGLCFCSGTTRQGATGGFVDKTLAHLSVTAGLVDCSDWMHRKKVVGTCLSGSGKHSFVVVLVEDESAIPGVRRGLDSLYEQRLGKDPDEEVLRSMEEMLERTEFWVIGEVVSLGEGAAEPLHAPRTRPSAIGVSISHRDGGAGTLGCRVRDRDNPSRFYLLSNWHVLVPDDDARREDEIFQPAVSDDRQGSAIARLSDWEKVDKHGNRDHVMDAAVAETWPACVGTTTPGPQAYRPSSQTVEAEPDMAVLKHGRTTGRRTGRVVCTKATLCVRYGGERPRFVDQIVIDSGGKKPFCRKGDSGSLVVRKRDKKPVGLLYAVNMTLRPEGAATTIYDACIANPIGPVLERFGVVVDEGRDGPVRPCRVSGKGNDRAPE